MAEFFVYDHEYGYAGKCYYTHKRGRVSSVFSYSPEYIARPGAYNIDPEFQMIEGSQFCDAAIPRVFADTAPDRWGRNLIYKRHVYESEQEGRIARALSDVDYLLGVSDVTRQGSLRYKTDRVGMFVHASDDIPKLISLPKLLNSTQALSMEDSDEAIKYLLDVGSASLGGARPKAAVRNDEKLYIAKFPHVHDEWDVMSWEYVALSIAQSAGINTPDFELIDVEGDKVLLLKRFDRAEHTDAACGRKSVQQEAEDSTIRIGYISAMTLLASDDGDKGDYADICLHMSDISVDYKRDLHELYRRMIFSVLINNTDDHLRNHGFLRAGSGWKLSPIFDVNPNPQRDAIRATSIYGTSGRETELRALQDNCGDYMLDEPSSNAIFREVRDAVKSWRDIAKRIGIKVHEIEMMSGVLDG